MHWCQIYNDCTLMQLHEVNTMNCLTVSGGEDTAANWLFRGHPAGCCVFIINCNVCKDRNEGKKTKISQCNFVDAQRVRIRFYVELKNSIYFIALCDRRQSTRLTVWPSASRFAAYLQLAGEEHWNAPVFCLRTICFLFWTSRWRHEYLQLPLL